MSSNSASSANNRTGNTSSEGYGFPTKDDYILAKKAGYDNYEHFMLSHELKPWDWSDVAEGREISRVLHEDDTGTSGNETSSGQGSGQ